MKLMANHGQLTITICDQWDGLTWSNSNKVVIALFVMLPSNVMMDFFAI
jgi:hypothetical protein